MKKSPIILTVVAGGLLLNLFWGYTVYSGDDMRRGEDAALEKITVMMRVLYLIRQDYVNGDEATYETLLDSAIHGMVGALDPHSSYLEPDDYSDMMDATEGQFGGLGVQVSTRGGFLTVVSPIPDTPGARAGLLPGDRIVKVDGVSTESEKLGVSIRRLKGEPGTSVILTIARDDLPPFEVTIERAIIEIPSVRDGELLANGIGYVRLTQFDEKTVGGLADALQDLKKQGMTSLIVDLRNNPGGLLRSAVDVSSLFLPKGRLVVSTEGRRPSQRERFETGGGDKFMNTPIVILVNGGSASAAEIVAGCLQDWKRAVVIGEPTFGKGSVQNIIQLPDGSALRLTTAKYYTPSRRVIDEHGIQPDIAVALSPDQLKNLIGRQRGLEDGAPIDPARDPQLARALEAIESYAILQGKMHADPERDAAKPTPGPTDDDDPEEEIE